MKFLTIVILCFSILGAFDWLIGNKIGVGKEFERAFSLFAPMALSMLGMIVIAPALGVWLNPLFKGFYKVFKIDPLIIPALTKIELVPEFDSFENAAFICANACVTLSGALPFMFLATKLLYKPLNALSSKIGINGVSSIAFLGTLVTNASTFGVMEKMDKKGVVLNSAFAVSASFVFGSHLAFTMAFDDSYTIPMILAKIIAGILAVIFALLIYREKSSQKS